MQSAIMKKISESANVKMPGKLRKTPLLEIEIPKELDTFAETRINDYIEECIKNLREECKVAEVIRGIEIEICFFNGSKN